MTTAFDDIVALRLRFQSVWNATFSGVPYIFDNEPQIDGHEGTWARFSVQPGEQKRRPGVALRTYDQRGWAYLQVFMPEDEADRDGWAMAEEIGNAFRDWHSEDWRVRTEAPAYKSIDREGEPYTILVTIKYKAEHRI
ncbi:hypothetical protein [Sphingobium sp. AP50]|uniref:hypothetical protein n=1 Tax=Sphingobium sp. AP50 TaxID=1884369 RepID=UPI000B8650E7|nr:hypothetical protein [Sphingobium sp. AP50]